MKPDQHIQGILNDSLEELDCPGILCAANHAGNISTYWAGSISRHDHQKRFYIYSITKTFTATAVLTLAQQGKLRLDDPFSNYLKRDRVPPAATIRQMLNHTSGLSDYGCQEYLDAVSQNPSTPWPYEKLMAFGLRETPLFEPSTGWAYSNPAYALLKELVEHISGMGFYDYLSEFIFKPAQLLETTPFLEPDFDHALLDAQDTVIQHDDFRATYSPGWILTGCLISTVSDLTRFFDCLFSEKILSKAWLDEMTKTVDVPYPLPEPVKAAYGLGLMHGRNHPLGNAYGHGGGGPGYTPFAHCFPTLAGQRFSLALVVNKSLPQTPFELVDNITRCLSELAAD